MPYGKIVAGRFQRLARIKDCSIGKKGNDKRAETLIFELSIGF
jgi:hypothetical protein